MFKNKVIRLVILCVIVALAPPFFTQETSGDQGYKRVPPPSEGDQKPRDAESICLSPESKDFIEAIQRGIIEKGGVLGKAALAKREVPFRPIRKGIDNALNSPEMKEKIGKMSKSKVAKILSEIGDYLVWISPANIDDINYAKNKWAKNFGVAISETILK